MEKLMGKAVEKILDIIIPYANKHVWDREIILSDKHQNSLETAGEIIQALLDDPKIPIIEYEPDAELPRDKYRLTSTENNNAYYGDTTFIVKSMKSRIYREAQQDMIDNGWVIRKVGG